MKTGYSISQSISRHDKSVNSASHRKWIKLTHHLDTQFTSKRNLIYLPFGLSIWYNLSNTKERTSFLEDQADIADIDERYAYCTEDKWNFIYINKTSNRVFKNFEEEVWRIIFSTLTISFPCQATSTA